MLRLLVLFVVSLILQGCGPKHEEPGISSWRRNLGDTKGDWGGVVSWWEEPGSGDNWTWTRPSRFGMLRAFLWSLWQPMSPYCHWVPVRMANILFPVPWVRMSRRPRTSSCGIPILVRAWGHLPSFQTSICSMLLHTAVMASLLLQGTTTCKTTLGSGMWQVVLCFTL